MKKKEKQDFDLNEAPESLTFADFVSPYSIAGITQILKSFSDVAERTHFDDDSFTFSIEAVISLTRMPTSIYIFYNF